MAELLSLPQSKDLSRRLESGGYGFVINCLPTWTGVDMIEIEVSESDGM